MGRKERTAPRARAHDPLDTEPRDALGGDPLAGAAVQRLAFGPAPVQLDGDEGGDGRPIHEAARPIHEAARLGTSGTSTSLPHLDRIQESFGGHDVSGVKAYTDRTAAKGATAMGAEAFTTGDRVAFAGTPSLHTAAHEAAHAVQQRGGVQLAGGVGHEGDPYERHADAVADRVVQGRSASDLLAPFSSAGGGAGAGPVQRKVFIKNSWLKRRVGPDYEQLKESDDAGVGLDGRKVGEMIDDAPNRYFDSAAEVLSYARGETTDIGYAPRQKSWVRLHKGKLIVVGEQHTKDGSVLTNLVEPTGTTQYMHEAFTGEEAEGDPDVAAAMSGRREDVRGDFGLTKPDAGDAAKQRGEDFVPKLRRVLEGLLISDSYAAGGGLKDTYVRMALLHAKGLGSGALYDAYQAHSALYDQATGELGGGTTLDKTCLGGAGPKTPLVDFLAAFRAYADTVAAADHASMSPADQRKFDRNYQIDAGPTKLTKGSELEKAEKARDVSMFKYVLRAKSNGTLLFGVGAEHELRLAGALDAAGVTHMTIAEYFATYGKK